MEKYFDDQVYTADKKSITNDQRLECFLGAFVPEITENDDHPLCKLKSSTKRSYYNKNFPAHIANYCLGKISYETFVDFSKNLSSATIDNLVKDFNEKTKVSRDTWQADIFEILKKILKKIVNKPKKVPNVKSKSKISEIKIINNQIFDGKKNIKISDELANNIRNDKQKYIEALLDVYAIDANRPIGSITIDTLSNINKKYTEHLNLQKNVFFDAECLYHVVRDNYEEGEQEFQNYKDEILCAANQFMFQNFNGPYEKVVNTLSYIVEVNCGTFIGKNIARSQEKQGTIHILVNDGEIVWVDKDE